MKRKIDKALEGFLKDELDDIYIKQNKENLFDEEDFIDDETYKQEDKEQSLEEMCRVIGVDIEVLRSIIEKKLMPEFITDARALSAKKVMQEFKDDSWEKKKLDLFIQDGFDFTEAVEKVKNEQLERRIKMLEQELYNRKNTIGSTYSKAKIDFEY